MRPPLHWRAIAALFLSSQVICGQSMNGVPNQTLTFTPSGTGGVPTPLSTILNQVVNPLAFGAKCDNLTDDHSALQAALNVGGTIYLPGICMTSVALSTVANSVVRGLGPATGIRLVSGSTGVTHILSVASNVTVEDFTLDGNNVVYANGNNGALSIFSSSNVTVNKVQIVNISASGSSNGQDGLYVFNSSGSVTNSYFHSIAGDCAYITTGSAFTFSNNRLDTCYLGGVYVNHSGYSYNPVIVSSNHIANIWDSANGTGANGNGIDVYNSWDVTLSDNFIINTQFSSFRVASSTDTMLSGNTGDYAGDNCIYLEFYSHDNTVTGNHCRNSKGALIVVENGLDHGNWMTTITGNQLFSANGNASNNVGAAVLCERACLIAANVIDGAFVGIVAGNGNTGASYTDTYLSGFGIKVASNVIHEMRPYIYTCSSSSGAMAANDIAFVGSTYATATKTAVISTAGFTLGSASFVTGHLALGDVITNHSQTGSCTVGTLGPYYVQLTGVSGTYSSGDTIFTGPNFGAATKIGSITAVVADFMGNNTYTVLMTTGALAYNDVIKDNTSGATATGSNVWGLNNYMNVGVEVNANDANPEVEITVENNQIEGYLTAAIAGQKNTAATLYAMSPAVLISGTTPGMTSSNRTTYAANIANGSTNTDSDTGISYLFNGTSWIPLGAQVAASPLGTALASATTIVPLTSIAHVTGTTAITTMTAPAGCATTGLGCVVRLIPDGLWTISSGTGAGQFKVGSTAVVGKALEETYDPATALWYPSY